MTAIPVSPPAASGLLDAASSGWRAWVVLALLSLAASLPGLHALPTWDRDEARYAQATSQMLETGDLIDIRYQDEPRYKKPIGIYWAQAATTTLFSDAEARDIRSYRLPSLISGVLAVWGLYWAGLALFGAGADGRRASFIAGAMTAVAFLPSSEAHIAKTDAALFAATIWAMGCLARMRAGIGDPKRMALGFWALMGVGVLIKGPIAPLVGLGAAATLWLWERDRKWLRPLLRPIGPILFVAIVLPWFILVETVGEGGFLREAFVVDFAPKVSGGGEHPTRPPGFHLLILPIFSFPMAFILPAAMLVVWKAARAGRDNPEYFATRFLVAWFAPTWIVFELATTKLAHYTLPAYAPLALAGGYAVAQAMAGPAKRWWAGATLMAVAGLAYAALFWPSLGIAAIRAEALEDYGAAAEAAQAQWLAFPDPPVWPAIAVAILSLASAAFLILKRHGAGLIAGLSAAFVLGIALRLVILPALPWMQATTTALAALDEVCGRPIDAAPSCAGTPPPARLDAIEYSEPSFVFETGTATRLPPDSAPDLVGVGPGERAAFLVNLSKPKGREAMAALEALAQETGRTLNRSSERYVLNYSNGNAAIFVGVVLEPSAIAQADPSQ